MAAQQYNLRWNNHTSNMVQVLGDLFEKEHMVDVTISCQAQFLKAHKIVLGSCSQYFQEIFDRHQTTPHPVIIMNGARFDDVRAIIEFMYRGEIKVCEGELESLLETAESLQVKGLSNIRASRLNQAHAGESATLNLSQNHGGANGNSVQAHKHNNSPQIGTKRSSNESLEKIVNIHKNAMTNNESHENGTGNNGLDLSETGSTPMHLRRKRKRNTAASNAKDLKDINENSNSGFKCGGSNSSNATGAQGADEDTCDDLPMTIKISPPYIRDIDEGDDDNWESQKDGTTRDSDGIQDSKGKAVSEPKEKIPRPPNAFMIFANEWRRKLATQNPNESNKEISVRLGIMWKNLAGNSKEDYFAASRQANDDHKKKYPDYYYSPKEARMRKRWKLQQQQTNQMMSSAQYNPVHLVKVYLDEGGEGGSGSPASNDGGGNGKKSANATSGKTSH